MSRTVYLAGPILGKTVGEANNWREQMRRDLGVYNIHGISPLRCEPPGIDGVYAGSYDDPKFGHMRAIASKNVFDTKSCDLVLAYMPKESRNPIPSLGTIIEMAYAWAIGKPVVLVTDDEFLLQHPLVMASASWVLPDLPSAVDLIAGLLGDYPE